MIRLPGEVSKAWNERQGPVVLSTVNSENIPDSIHLESVSIISDDTIAIADNTFSEKEGNIQPGSKAAILFIAKSGISWQIKGRIENQPDHSAVLLKVAAVFKGSERINVNGVESGLNQKHPGLSSESVRNVANNGANEEEFKKERAGVLRRFANKLIAVSLLTILIVCVLLSRGQIEKATGFELPEFMIVEILRIELVSVDIPFVSDWVDIPANDPRGILHLSISGIQGNFINNGVDGDLYVVQGLVENQYRKVRSSISIKIELKGLSGQTLMIETVYAGHRLSDEQLKTLDVESIRRLLTNQYGTDKNNAKVRTGQRLPFIAVFEIDAMKGMEAFSEFIVTPHGSYPWAADIEQDVEE